MDRPTKPYEQVKTMLGNSSIAWEKLLEYIRFFYVMDELWEEGKPTHKHYNNLRFRRGGKTLITLSIRDGFFLVTIVLGKDERMAFDEKREKFGDSICKLYDDAHTYHDGKWLGFEMHDDLLVDDVVRLLHIKRKPNRKVMPESTKKCGSLDIGLPHEDITNYLS